MPSLTEVLQHVSRSQRRYRQRAGTFKQPATPACCILQPRGVVLPRELAGSAGVQRRAGGPRVTPSLVTPVSDRDAVPPVEVRWAAIPCPEEEALPTTATGVASLSWILRRHGPGAPELTSCAKHSMLPPSRSMVEPSDADVSTYCNGAC